jgi:hypothetical protein
LRKFTKIVKPIADLIVGDTLKVGTSEFTWI